MYKKYPFFDEPQDNANIWRYMDFTKFASLLDKQALFFVRADKLGDPFEGSYSKANISHRQQKFEDRAGSNHLQFWSDQCRQMLKSVAFSCWHINRYESAAMWKLYLKSNEGIAIRSNFGRLRDSFSKKEKHDIYIGEVHYIDYEREDMPLHSISPFIHKRKSFEHERELRAIIWKTTENIEWVNGSMFVKRGSRKIAVTSLPPFDDGLYVAVNLDLLIREIYLAPTSPKWLYELVESVTRKYGYKKEICQSSLDEKPVY